MKKRIALVSLALIFLVGCIASCALTQKITDPFAYASYGTLSTTLSTYKIINRVFTGLRASKEVSDQKWADFEKLANKFLDEHISASKTMADYKRGIVSQNSADAAIKLLDVALQKLEDYYNAQIPEGKREPLIK
jgi:hypothetical protein